MGKYLHYDPAKGSAENYFTFIFKAIADELAEANRLMRIELEVKVGSFRFTDERFKEITEDKA